MRALVCLVLPRHSPAVASSGMPGSSSAPTVGTACLALVKDQGTVSVEVNPFGTESYGVAIVTLTSDGGRGPDGLRL